MGEDLAPQPNSSKLEGLSLGLVDGHGKGRSNRELAPLPLKRVLTWLRNEGNSWNEDNSSRLNNSALEKLVVNAIIKYQAGSIAQTLAWIDVSEEHKRHARLEVQNVLGETIWFQCV